MSDEPAICLNPFSRPYANLSHSKPNSQTVSENAQIRFILRFILLFCEKNTDYTGKTSGITRVILFIENLFSAGSYPIICSFLRNEA